METKIDAEQFKLLRSDLEIFFFSLRRWFQWLVVWIFLSFVVQVLQWFGIRP